MAMLHNRININKYVLKAMHQPSTSTGYALYTRENIDKMTQAEQDSEYIRYSNLYYNSPTNIRRIFITCKRVEIHYYIPPHTPNKNNINWVTVSYDLKKDTGFSDFYSMADNMMSTYGGSRLYSFTGNILKVLNSTYTCNNIEEVYIDWLLFLSQDSERYFGKFETLANYVVNTQRFIVNKNRVNLLARLFFEQFTDSRDAIKKFPRLKTISMISNLDSIITYSGTKRFGANVNKTWLELNSKVIKASNSLVIPYIINKNRSELSFITKESQYKFDKDLRDYIRHRSKGDRVVMNKQESSYRAIKRSSSDTIENLLVNIEKEYGTDKVQVILKAVTAGMSRRELDDMFVEFTPVNRLRMTSLINFSVSGETITEEMLNKHREDKEDSDNKKRMNLGKGVEITQDDIGLTDKIFNDLTVLKDLRAEYFTLQPSEDGAVELIKTNLNVIAHVVVIDHKVYINPYRFRGLVNKGESGKGLIVIKGLYECSIELNNTYKMKKLIPAVLSEDNKTVLKYGRIELEEV